MFSAEVAQCYERPACNREACCRSEVHALALATGSSASARLVRIQPSASFFCRGSSVGIQRKLYLEQPLLSGRTQVRILPSAPRGRNSVVECRYIIWPKDGGSTPSVPAYSDLAQHEKSVGIQFPKAEVKVLQSLPFSRVLGGEPRLMTLVSGGSIPSVGALDNRCPYCYIGDVEDANALKVGTVIEVVILCALGVPGDRAVVTNRFDFEGRIWISLVFPSRDTGRYIDVPEQYSPSRGREGTYWKVV